MTVGAVRRTGNATGRTHNETAPSTLHTANANHRAACNAKA